MFSPKFATRPTLCLVLASLTALFMATSPPRVTAGAQQEDRYRWLEEVNDQKVLDWAKKHNAETTSALTSGLAFKGLHERLLKTYDSAERLPMISKAGGFYYNFWRDGQNPRGLWRRTTLEEYKKAQPQWEILLDLDALAQAEKENWVFQGAKLLHPTHDRVLISLSRGGADAAVVREFDLTTRSFVKDGFVLPEAKSIVSWRDRDSIFVGTDFGPGSLTKSQYPRQVKEWQRGTPLAAARLAFEGSPDDMRVMAFRDHTKGFEREFVYRIPTFHTAEVYLRQDGQFVKLDVPVDASTRLVRDQLFVSLRGPWQVGGKTYPAGALLTMSFDAFQKGGRQFDVLFEPAPRRSLSSWTATKNYVLLTEMDNVRDRVYVLRRENGAWQREPLPGAPAFSTVHVGPVDAEESDDYFMVVTDFLTPPTLYLGTAGQGPAAVLKAAPASFDATGLVVTQHEATSKDGTRIPYFQVARKDLALDGRNPTLLTGYGGFQLSSTPHYDATAGAAWLERGGVYVVANIRGGGEFGPQWHQAALKGNRQRAYDDFIAVAEHLVSRKVTSPRHLGTMGASNGGLLVGNMLVQRPDLFGAVVCQVPLLDMERYHKLLAGASWMDEYGNPDDPKEWAALRTISPYHNVRKGVHYPRTLFTTSTRDDRVHPGHARKMFAKMKDMGHNVLYYENVEGGHGGAADYNQVAFLEAMAFRFLWEELQ
jgi:prolyl oligopeptidase